MKFALLVALSIFGSVTIAQADDETPQSALYDAIDVAPTTPGLVEGKTIEVKTSGPVICTKETEKKVSKVTCKLALEESSPDLETFYKNLDVKEPLINKSEERYQKTAGPVTCEAWPTGIWPVRNWHYKCDFSF